MAVATSAQCAWQSALAQGLTQLGESADAALLAAFAQYVALLRKWSGAYNLTAVTQPDEIVRQHFLDSASVLPHLRGPRVLDVGTGAGFPGLVIALLRPDWRVSVIDAVAKKTRFCMQVAHALKLANVTVIHGRIEASLFERGFDAVVSRAFASLQQFVSVARPHVAPGGRLVAMKGKLAREELAPVNALEPRAQSLSVPGLEASRHAVIIEPGGVAS